MMTAYRTRKPARVDSRIFVGGPYPPFTVWDAYRWPILGGVIVAAVLLAAWIAGGLRIG